jgi:hypothetical protein
MFTETLPSPTFSDSPPAAIPRLFEAHFLRLTSGSAAPWNRKTISGILALVTLWAVWMLATWAHWGNLTIDTGREIYIPAVLAQGKMLYRDIWFMYGPAAPYLNAHLFRVLGVHLNVLYWAGSLSALGSAILLYLVGMRLSSALAGWTAGAVVVIQAFHPSLFSFPLPYSFSSVYGCLVACFFLWLMVLATSSKNWGWIMGAGLTAAIALLLKLEFGAACYTTLPLLIAARSVQRRTWKSIPVDLAAILPGILICVLVIRWMISIAGVDFILQENFMSWPTSYFMKTYGKFWLATTGFSITGAALADAAQRTFVFLGILQGFHLLASWRRTGQREIVLRSALFLTALVSLMITQSWGDALRTVFFPQDMGFYIALAAAAAWWNFWRHPSEGRAAAVALLLSFAALLAFRILLRVIPWGYAIYYNGPVVLSFLMIARAFIPHSGRSRHFVFWTELLICIACLMITVLNSRRSDYPGRPLGVLTTERGTIVVPKTQAEQYLAAIQFMKEKNAQGESVLSIPEDTSLYFLSGINCPLRVFAFTPGLVVPGKMTDDVIREIDRKRVRYLIWSNRLFPEYGVLRFGTDFDQTLGRYLMTHYHRVRPLLADAVSLGDWTAEIWERNAELQTE